MLGRDTTADGGSTWPGARTGLHAVVVNPFLKSWWKDNAGQASMRPMLWLSAPSDGVGKKEPSEAGVVGVLEHVREKSPGVPRSLDRWEDQRRLKWLRESSKRLPREGRADSGALS
jgi:hypothetical protein